MYNWLALSLVRHESDIVAIAVYLHYDRFEALYTRKMESTEEDCSHVKAFSVFLRESAIRNLDRVAFQKEYFTLLFRNCNTIIMSKYTDLKNALFLVKDLNEEEITTKMTLDSLLESFRKRFSHGNPPFFGEPEKEA
jgi:hypothetical protein